MRESTSVRARITRLIAAVLLVLSAFAWFAAPSSVAAPTRQQIAAAESRLNALNSQQSLLDEQYNAAVFALNQAEQQLVKAQEAVGAATAAHDQAVGDLSRRVRAAYEGAGSSLGILLASQSVADLSDRVAFLNQIAQGDQLASVRASVTGQRARWAAGDMQRAVHARAAALHSLQSKKAELVRTIDRQRSDISHMKAALRRAIRLAEARRRRHAQMLARLRLQQAQQAAPQQSFGGSQFVPPVNGSQAQIAIAAARSQIGVPYIYAASQPGVGFDCSGLTMWAWGQAGVSLPHVAALQYADLPHVSQSGLQPGDLVFFYSPIHHVGMYVGGGMMIDAPHTGAYVEEVPVYWAAYSGAARP
jgi:cell wall-associated NlpC family hydrolase